MTLYGLDFLHDELDTPFQKEERRSLKRMQDDWIIISECQKRQRNGERVKLTRKLGHDYIIEEY